MSEAAHLPAIRKFLLETYGEHGAAVRDDEPLLGDLLDSIGVMTLASHLEESFGISIGGHEMDPANFGTLLNLARFVDRKIADH